MNKKLKNQVENIVNANIGLEEVNKLLKLFKKKKAIQISILDEYGSYPTGVALHEKDSKQIKLVLKKYRKYVKRFLEQNVIY